MRDRQPLVVLRRRPTRRDVPSEVILCVLDLRRLKLVIVVGVDVEVHDVVPQIGHRLRAAGCSGAAAVRRPHVGREVPDDVADGHFVLDHLRLSIFL